MGFRFIAVTVAQRPKTLDFDEMPFFCYVHEPVYFARDRSQSRVDYLVKWWNEAHKQALDFYPDATHFFDIATYYLPQIQSLRLLASRYEQLGCPEIILSGNVWVKTRVRPLPHIETYDVWGYPEMAGLSYRWIRPSGRLVQVDHTALPFIYPVEYYRNHPFHNRQDWSAAAVPLWYSDFCEETRAPVFVDLSIPFFRNEANSGLIRRSFAKRARIYLGRKLRQLGVK